MKTALLNLLALLWLLFGAALWAWVAMNVVVDHMQPVPTGWENPASQQILVYGD